MLTFRKVVFLLLFIAGFSFLGYFSQAGAANSGNIVKAPPYNAKPGDGTFYVVQCWRPGRWIGPGRFLPTWSGYSTSGNGKEDGNDDRVLDRGNFEWWGGSTDGRNSAIAQLRCRESDSGKYWTGVWRKGRKNDGPLWEKAGQRNLRINGEGDYWRQNIRVRSGAEIVDIISDWTACRLQSSSSRGALPQVWIQSENTTTGDIPLASLKELERLEERVNGYYATKPAFRPRLAENSQRCLNTEGDPRWGVQGDTAFSWFPSNLSEQIINSYNYQGRPTINAKAAEVYHNTAFLSGTSEKIKGDVSMQAGHAGTAKVLRVGLLCAERNRSEGSDDCAELLQKDPSQAGYYKWENRRGQYALLGDVALSVADKESPSLESVSLSREDGSAPVRGERGYAAFSEEKSGMVHLEGAYDQGGGLQYAVIQGGPPETWNSNTLLNTIPPRQAYTGPRWFGKNDVSMTQVGFWTAVSTGNWEGSPQRFEFQWQRCRNTLCTDIPEATNPSYIPKDEDLGYSLRTRVTAIRGEQEVSVYSNQSQVGRSDNGWLLRDIAERRKAALFGAPRVGQTLTLLPSEENSFLGKDDSKIEDVQVWRCSSVQMPKKNCQPAGTTKNGLYVVQGDDVYQWLKVDTSSDYNFPGMYNEGQVSFYQFATMQVDYPEYAGIGGRPPTGDVGILPAYSEIKSLCPQRSETVLRSAFSREDIWQLPLEASTKTDPCPTSLGSVAAFPIDEEKRQGIDSQHGLWSEGLNIPGIKVYDFCTRDSGNLCTSRSSSKITKAPPLIWDTTAPSFSREVACKEPDGENGWHITDPRCQFQTADRFAACAEDFDFVSNPAEIYCRSGNLVSLKQKTTWRETSPASSSNKGSDLSGDLSSIPLQLSEGRPAIEAEAEDRVGNIAEREYEDFVKIDTENPLPLLVSEGPGEMDPEGYESLRYREEDGAVERAEPGSPDGFEVPRAPDETNDPLPSANPEEAENCVLCWRVEGLEASSGTPGEFDYDPESQMQCQLVYGGSGRTPEEEAADWVDPAWPLDMSATEKAGGDAALGEVVPGLGSSLYAPVVADSTGWNCAPEGHDGDEVLVAPFVMAGRPDGHYLLRVRQKDRAGLTSTWTGRPFIYDTTPPEPGALVSTASSEANPGESATRQWQFSWGWDLLARGGNAGSYCFVAEVDSEQLVRRSGWGCGPTAAPDDRPEGVQPLQFRKTLPGERALRAQAQGLDRPDPLETPMPFPGVRGEGRGTLAGLPDGSYFVGVLQRDKLGQVTSFEEVCQDEDRVSIGSELSESLACIGFSKNTDSVGPVPEPDVDLESFLPKESVTSRRTEAELRIESSNPLNSGQAFFPMDGWITHATPQELYSRCQTMDQNYSEYWPGNLAWDLQRQRIGPENTPINCPDGAEDYQTAIRHEGTLALNGSQTGVLDPASPWAYGNFILNIFWLRPTLEDESRPASESAYRSEP